MPDSRFRRALTCGMIAAAATAGWSVGVGRRGGDALAVFRLAGRTLLALRGLAAEGIPGYAAFLGAVHHLAVATLWGMLLAAVALPLRPLRRTAVLLAGGAAVWGLSRTVLPAAARFDLGLAEGAPRLLAFALFGAGLAAGALLASARTRR